MCNSQYIKNESNRELEKNFQVKPINPTSLLHIAILQILYYQFAVQVMKTYKPATSQIS
jgi:hypothetical protein